MGAGSPLGGPCGGRGDAGVWDGRPFHGRCTEMQEKGRPARHRDLGLRLVKGSGGEAEV